MDGLWFESRKGQKVKTGSGAPLANNSVDYGMEGLWFESRKGQKVQTGSGAQLANNSVGTGIISRGQSGRGMKLSIHLHLEPRLRMSGAIPLLSLYAFMEGIGKTLTLFNSLKGTATTDRKKRNKCLSLKMWKKKAVEERTVYRNHLGGAG
jgi:hypothetical protein